jgi:hypothetical protein
MVRRADIAIKAQQMGTVHQTNLVRMLREREEMIRNHHKLRTGRAPEAPFTLDGQAADEIERLQRLLDGRDDFLVRIGQFQSFTDSLSNQPT